MMPKPEILSKIEIKNRANGFLKDYNPDRQIPVPIDFIAEEKLIHFCYNLIF